MSTKDLDLESFITNFKMRTKIQVLSMYILFGLIGPALSLLQGHSDFLSVLASHLWPTWGIATIEYSVGSIIAALYAVGANLLLFSILGGLALLSNSVTWNGFFLSLVVTLIFAFSYVMHSIDLLCISIALVLHGVTLGIKTKLM